MGGSTTTSKEKKYSCTLSWYRNQTMQMFYPKQVQTACHISCSPEWHIC